MVSWALLTGLILVLGIALFVRRAELGRMAAGFGLHDQLLAAEWLDDAESERLKAVRDRVRQTLCRAWGDRSVGPQAISLDCRVGL